MNRALTTLLLLSLGAVAWAIDTGPAFDDPELQARYERLTSELRCLVCQNQTIADSNAGLAIDLRDKTKEMIAAGASDEEILTFMTDRYGDFVRYRPPLKPHTALLWAAPALLLLGGLTIGGVLIARKSRLASEDDLDDAEGPGTAGGEAA